jgi:hypothetical protein
MNGKVLTSAFTKFGTVKKLDVVISKVIIDIIIFEKWFIY